MNDQILIFKIQNLKVGLLVIGDSSLRGCGSLWSVVQSAHLLSGGHRALPICLCHKRPEATPTPMAKGMNTRNTVAMEPPIRNQSSAPNAMNSQHDTRADNRPLEHAFQTGSADALVLIVIDAATAETAIM